MSKKLNFEKGLFIVLGLIISLLAVLSFLPQKSNNRVYGASDDVTTSYSFTSGSNLIMPLKTSYSSDDNPPYNLYTTQYYSFYVDYLDATFVRLFFKDEDGYSHDFEFNFSDFVNYTIPMPEPYDDISLFGVAPSYYLVGARRINNFMAERHINFYISVSGDFNANVSSVRIGSDVLGSYVRYYDDNNNSFAIHFEISGNLYLFDRTYILNVGLDNPYYWNGYNDGVLDGSRDSYQNGYNAGNSVGYQSGYNAGVSASNVYTFNSLFGAVFDAPIQALTGLLDFNLLGVNLFGLFTGLLSLAIIIWILKLAFGGK